MKPDDEGCRQWWHGECLKFKPADYRQAEQGEWFCALALHLGQVWFTLLEEKILIQKMIMLDIHLLAE